MLLSVRKKKRRFVLKNIWNFVGLWQKLLTSREIVFKLVGDFQIEEGTTILRRNVFKDTNIDMSFVTVALDNNLSDGIAVGNHSSHIRFHVYV